MQMLDGHVVLITGGGSGLGLGLARYFRNEGAQLAIMEIAEEKLAELKAEFGDEVLLVQGDVTRLDDLTACRSAVLERYGRLDALVGAQGVFDGNVPLKQIPTENIPALFDELFRTNVLGYILPVRVFIDVLDENDGAVVLTSSVAAYAADGGGLFYTATKGAVVSLVKQLAFEFAPRVRVNSVAPAAFANSQLRGPKALGMQGWKQSDIPKDAFVESFKQLAPLQELPTPEDYAPLYAFLASRHNKVMTGTTVLAEQGVLNRAVLTATGVVDHV
ncbi:SDR family oxidoreductase [Streptomyces aurantiacus]|uniref:3-phenylpropionate-dihydrodiol/cinnamic acid-dihydrodiol dehydrogenase n=1 Tax=Streptomyces aurantiacus TaxID=47760 RepID=A0A7G1PF11_9ACTN|nr:SDR family oxidoreductase [Streptomyces aurantiacus]BCL33161.1 3-phenylpropionate-dihydrodiol/cinnamic acid-dihydrodiol dehydrogenase [Streptomyces aurantiacus]